MRVRHAPGMPVMTMICVAAKMASQTLVGGIVLTCTCGSIAHAWTVKAVHTYGRSLDAPFHLTLDAVPMEPRDTADINVNTLTDSAVNALTRLRAVRACFPPTHINLDRFVAMT